VCEEIILLAEIFGADSFAGSCNLDTSGGTIRVVNGCCWREGTCMRRLAGLVRWLFGARVRHQAQDDDPGLPFTPEELGRLIRSGKREDMKRLADGLACRSMPHRATHHGAAH
jgi:hypothetical protein